MLSRYSQITGLSYSTMPSSVTRVGIFESGLLAASTGSVVPMLQSSTWLSMPRRMAQASAFRPYQPVEKVVGQPKWSGSMLRATAAV